MPIRIHDTLTGRLTVFTPRQPGKVGVYCCGPTTYDVAHVGHARAAITPDILVRHLRARGHVVTYVRNITDVDDKILNRAKERGEEPTDLSARYAKLYQEDIADIGCQKPDVEPKVSEHIPEIISIIETLIEKGAAYEVKMPDGARDVYYAVRTFHGYGKLSKRNIDELQVGARIEASDEKRDPLDFALWKGCTEGEWGWPSPWGKGRPGWHIECSAMSLKYLRDCFDIHTGGMDLIFPHHENELAQSEAAHPELAPLANIWMHNGFVNVDKEKMSKSLGNFFTLRDVLNRHDPEAVRWFLLGVHYKGPINFDVEKPENGRVVFPGILEAERRVDYFYTTVERLETLAQSSPETPAGKPPKHVSPGALDLAVTARSRVDEALDDDLNSAVAQTIIGEVAKTANELCDLVARKKKDADLQKWAPFIAGQLRTALVECLGALGMMQTPADVYKSRTQVRRLGLLGKTADDINGALAARDEARKNKDFAKSDAIRKDLADAGIEVADSPTGSTWRIAAI
ncbi:MAG: cysteine--tRNA ligase [Polyangiaceae bacterium]|nr:cysteine--tRNA ligase [Polyangiaceae bacterium]